MATYLQAGGRLRMVPAEVRARENELDEKGVALIERWVKDPDGVGAKVAAEAKEAEEHARLARRARAPETHEELRDRLRAESDDLQASIAQANADHRAEQAIATAAAEAPAPTSKRRASKPAEE